MDIERFMQGYRSAWEGRDENLFCALFALAITAMGPAGTFDTEWDGDPARQVKACAEAIARRLGNTETLG